MYPMYKIKLHDPSANDSHRPIELLPFEGIIKFPLARSRAHRSRKGSANARANIRRGRKIGKGNERASSLRIRFVEHRRGDPASKSSPIRYFFVSSFHSSPFFFPSFLFFSVSSSALCRSRLRILVSARRRSERRKFLSFFR